jgi:methionyl-tRNA formyltransferase
MLSALIMRIVFMGAPDFAAPTLLEIVRQGHEIVAVYTRAPKPAGRRGLELTKTPVHAIASDIDSDKPQGFAGAGGVSRA